MMRWKQRDVARGHNAQLNVGCCTENKGIKWNLQVNGEITLPHSKLFLYLASRTLAASHMSLAIRSVDSWLGRFTSL